MTELIIVRLHPTSPESPANFTNDLAGLSISAYDLTVQNDTGGALIGTAAGLAAVPSLGDNTVDITSTAIMQHYDDWMDGPLSIRSTLAAATAAIIANPPAGTPGYPTAQSFSLRFEITRDGLPITDDVVDYEVLSVQVGSLPTDQAWYFNAIQYQNNGAITASTYITIPPAPPAGAPTPLLTLPPNGTPPPFDTLRTAIDAVLADDPGSGDSLATYGLQQQNLTADRCGQIAAEIIWNRYFVPQPSEPSSFDYGTLYSNPEPESGVNQQNADTARQQFEGNWNSYYATNNAQVTALTSFVYAAWAAVICEQTSSQAPSAGLPFPIITGQPGTPVDSAVILTSTASPPPADPPALDPSFAVPAAYFYAMTAALPAQVPIDQRYNLAVYSPQVKTQQDLTTAIATDIVNASEGFVTLTGASAITASQATLRLTALGAVTGSLPSVQLQAPITQLVTDWLNYTGSIAGIDTDFWVGEVSTYESDYLNLVLQIITGGYQPLMTAITQPPLSVGTVGALVAVTDQQWRTFFVPTTGSPNLTLLPPFTEPGTPTERTEAFIRHLEAFFTVPTELIPAQGLAPGTPGSLGTPIGDILAAFIANYASEGGGTFTFGSAWDSTAVTAAIADTLPGDAAAQAWLTQALNAIEALYGVVGFAPSELRFSLMEALYARGFTSTASIQRLTPGDFQAALTGSVAYQYAAQIQSAAGGSTAASPTTGGTFQPVNPDGSLTNCVPPAHLSPFGPVAYLAELLQAGPGSTCEQPQDPDTAEQFGSLLTTRRGPLGQLLATRPNLQTPIPAIDLVNESLEALVAAVVPGGSGTLGGAVLDTADVPDADARYAAIPANSSPAVVDVPAASSAAYTALKADFSAPILPYNQAIDINRTYLRKLCTTRFATMRRFRKDITEFVLDPAPADEPSGFVRHQWRYPVRIDMAIEYLCITPEEYETLFSPPTSTDTNTDTNIGVNSVWGLYGYPSAEVDGVSWTQSALSVPQFLRRTGLTYCELVELQKCGPVPFTVVELRDGRDTAAAANAPGTPAAPGTLPDCEPCCLEDWRLTLGGGGTDSDVGQVDISAELYQLIVFIRLWRRACATARGTLTLCRLADIAGVLGLFTATGVNPDFIRQLAALLILHEDFGISLDAHLSGASASSTPIDRIPLLALWAQPAPSAAQFDRAVRLLLDGISRHARSRYAAKHREPQFAKVLAANLDPLSALAGFTPSTSTSTSTDTWQAAPTHTLRFAEVLGKVYASEFTVGDLIFLFTVAPHLDGDDPFPPADAEETVDDPLALPEVEPGGGGHSLWDLRRALLDAEPTADEARAWNWARISAVLHEEYGYEPTGGGDTLAALGAHFFPNIVERTGQPVGLAQRQFRTPLAAAETSPSMWTAQEGPFSYDATAQELFTRLPLHDAEVIARLGELRALRPVEQVAVRELYFAPRAALAPFAALFADFGAAVDRLVQEPDEDARFEYFQLQFARFHRRCTLIAEHLAEHVHSVVGRRRGDDHQREHDHDREHDREARARFAAAWRVLRGLLADGNLALGPWEQDSGAPPAVTWGPQPSGGAFAALVGLAGTGLVGEYRVGDAVVWRETRSPLTAFGRARDEGNAPVPTILPAFDTTLTPDQARYAGVRNGFALRDRDGLPLGGAQPYTVRWTGVLLIEQRGAYRFEIDRPHPHHAAAAACETRRRVTLRRGQRAWVLLDEGAPGGESAPEQRSGQRSEPLPLRRGAYRITVEFDQSAPEYSVQQDVRPTHTGIEVRYSGPDTEDHFEAVETGHLYRGVAQHTLGEGIVRSGDEGQAPLVTPITNGQSAAQFLDGQYSSSLRDIRRTYQRAFKALLFAELFRLSAEPVRAYRRSELGFFYDNPQIFEGTSYPRTGPTSFDTHHAWFDADLLPVSDPYPPEPLPPDPVTDERADPSPQRRAALFDGWERVFDYCRLRAETADTREHPAWLLFAEVSEDQPDAPAELLRHLGIDLRDAPALLTYFDNPQYALGPNDLGDERWAVRVWHGFVWLRRLREHFARGPLGEARPDLWASTDPNAPIGAPPETGDANLTAFVQKGALASGRPHRYELVRQLNDELRERARRALIAYLCALDRVALPWPTGSGSGSGSGYATTPRDLSDLLLQDVEAGIGQRLSRIEDAASSVQAFAQRARIGLEAPAVVLDGEFTGLWERRWSTFHTWEACRRREVYLENWIAWDDLRGARRFEAFRHLEDDLRRSTLSIAAPGGVTWWPDAALPPHPALQLAQDREPVEDQLLQPAIEGFGLYANPERAARPTWLTALPGASSGSGTSAAPGGTGTGATRNPPAGDNPPSGTAAATAKRRGRKQTAALETAGPAAASADIEPAAAAPPSAPSQPSQPTASDGTPLPLWLQAAAGLGTDFIRVAAAGVPPASAHFRPHHGGEAACCAECGEEHPPLVDEYYFWLAASEYFLDTDITQDADTGVPATSATSGPTDETSSWEQPNLLPGLLQWNPEPMVHLCWSRVHHGEFEPPRRDTTGLPLDPALVEGGTAPQLTFMGRTGDSLRFEVSPGQAPVGYTDPTPPGFRYDIADDSAVALPLVAAATGTTPPTYPGGLAAYPFFVYVDPGAAVEPLSPYAVALTVASALRTHCRFDAALKWYELAYAPLTGDNTWALCDSETTGTPVTGRPPSTGTGTITVNQPQPPTTTVPTGPGQTVAISDTACCPASPANPRQARQRAVLLAYLDALSQWAEALLCRNSPETAQQAEVVLGALTRILGAQPSTVRAQGDAGEPQSLADFAARPAPLNPRLLALYERTAERLALIRLDQDGRRLRYARRRDDAEFWGSQTLRDGWREAPGTSGSCDGGPCEGEYCEDLDEELCCCGPYRFTFLVQKALDLANDARALGGSLLSAYEKNDAEALAALRSVQDRQIAELGLASKQYAWREADWQVQALDTSKQGAQARLRYYQQLIAAGLDAGETSYEALTGVSVASRTAGTVTEAIAQAMDTTPDVAVGVAGMGPYEATQLPIGSKLGGSFSTAARIMNLLAEIASTGAGLSLTEAGWTRRVQEWQLQVTTITIEIEQITQQTLAAERRRDVALRDLNQHQQQIEHTIEVEDFLRDKFSNAELYLYLVQETSALYRRMYDLARHAALRAQRAYNYERGHTARRFLPDPGWDDLHEALTAGDALHVAVRRMETSYLDLNCREYELTKHISLRLDFPAAFLSLQQTGRAEIEIPEWIFDLDYPGQYMRRIKNVTLTIPCVVGPYTGVHCRLTLLGSDTRVDPRLLGPAARCCGDRGQCVDHYDCRPVCEECDREGRDGCGRPCADTGTDNPCGPCGDLAGYLPRPEDPRIVRGYAATEAIATSSGQNDSGLFELSFRDERYLPFEFAGAVSRWRIELPPENNRFDFDSLTDVVVHLNYTAREGGEPLRHAAQAWAGQHLPGAGVRLFDVRHDLPDAWTRLRSVTLPGAPAALALRLSRAHFPYLPGGCSLRITKVGLFVEVDGARCHDGLPTKFVPVHDRIHGPGEPCDCDGREVECTADPDLPDLFHGVLDLPLGPLGRGGERELGEFLFELPGRRITRAYLLCGYDTEARP